jgi:His-Xaa-Ser system protein HxsD
MNNKYEFLEENKKVKIYLPEKIYTKEVILQTTYVLLEKYYFFIDFDNKENNFIVYMWSKEDHSLNINHINQFLDELIESASYIDQLKRSKEIREIILERALLTQVTHEEEDLD